VSRSIVVEFRLITTSFDADHDRLIVKLSVAEIPLVGELVNVDGEPYVVFERGSSFAPYDDTQFVVARVLGLQGAEDTLLKKQGLR
jgi:hypothetical protein